MDYTNIVLTKFYPIFDAENNLKNQIRKNGDNLNSHDSLKFQVYQKYEEHLKNEDDWR